MTQARRGGRKKMVKHSSNFDYYLETSSSQFSMQSMSDSQMNQGRLLQ